MLGQRGRRMLGILLMASSLSVGVLLPATVSAEGELPDERTKATVEKTAYWNGDNTNYSQNAATKSFPPEAVCLVQPAACFFPNDNPVGQAGNTLIETLDAQQRELLTAIQAADENFPPEDPVPPDTLPVSVAFGLSNYRSAVQFELPPVPSGEEVDSFRMVLTQSDPTYASESPAFRRAVLAALTCASEGQAEPIGGDANPTGRCSQAEFAKVANECESENARTPGPCLSDGTPLLVEACPITEAGWEGERAQDEDDLPEVDCLFTATGTPVTVEGGTFWVFDLTFTAQDWYAGNLANNGLLLRPGNAENFAYGDPETTYSKQVTFANTVEVAVESSAPQTFGGGGGGTFDGGTASSGGGDVGTSTDSGGGFASSPQQTLTSESFSTGGGFPSSTTSEPISTEAPAVSSDPGVATPVEAPAQEQVQTLAANAPLGQPESVWWLWVLLAATFLGGGYLLAMSLTQEAVAEAARNGGAMTRLLERRAAQSAPDLVSG